VKAEMPEVAYASKTVGGEIASPEDHKREK
jgi:hypothetical protein